MDDGQLDEQISQKDQSLAAISVIVELDALADLIDEYGGDDAEQWRRWQVTRDAALVTVSHIARRWKWPRPDRKQDIAPSTAEQLSKQSACRGRCRGRQ